jgi:hypothetical protein
MRGYTRRYIIERKDLLNYRWKEVSKCGDGRKWFEMTFKAEKYVCFKD